MHPFRIGERVFLSIVFSTIEETVIYLEGGEYFCIVTKGRRLDSDELGIHPGTLVPKDKLFPKASDVIPLSGTLATLPLVSSSCCCRRRLLSQSPDSRTRAHSSNGSDSRITVTPTRPCRSR